MRDLDEPSADSPEQNSQDRRPPAPNEPPGTSDERSKASGIFSDIEALRLSSDQLLGGGTHEILSHVSVRKPNKHEFFRTNPGLKMTLATTVFVDKTDRNEVYFVPPPMRGVLLGELKPVLLTLAITRQSALLIWPLALPDEQGRSLAWHETARQAAELAKTQWTRMTADMGLGAYRIYRAEGQLTEPMWPERPFAELLEIAFRGRIIDNEDHPVVKRLRGLT